MRCHFMLLLLLGKSLAQEATKEPVLKEETKITLHEDPGKDPSFEHLFSKELALAQKALSSQEKEISRVKKSLSALAESGRRYFLESAPKPPTDKFIAVFDGGSTGTRLNIYQFDGKGLVLKSHFFKNIPGGVHTSKAPKDDIQALLSAGETFLEKNHHSTGYDFPMVFNGTAGLRLVGERARNSLILSIKEAIKESTKREVEVRVIDGKEEGFYAWAALVFVTQMKDKIGIFDLGGGSAQISFEVEKDLQDAQEGIVHGKNKDVLSRSFLGMGLFAGLERVRKSDEKKHCAWGRESFSLPQCKMHMKSVIGAMIQETTAGKEIAPGISQVNTIFVTSFIAEMLNSLQTPGTAQFKDIKKVANSLCRKDYSGSNPGKEETPGRNRLDCVGVTYAIIFMENLGVGLFTPIRNASKIPTDISWSLGRALSLLE
ncbi:ectonucleoside triphosphate diphosphohydrolase 5/6 [Nematocida major]|uniref:ectonucleoside triphosphate diphosphohydrolase 5/6 n=1 Tax=Nematocida major TaxID=1912982 RepID=UPI002007E014|nr:ectonucleoside triphosphate diphosphohydrolase 5/6 [Nematocida major]KAH9387406.1 ectonucleoside triphosphate diphosphohydrolase 5/6 [Nematocida major]